MKSLSIIAIPLVALLLGSCSSTQQASNKAYGDDVYYSPKANANEQTANKQQPASSTPATEYSTPVKDADQGQSVNQENRFDYDGNSSSTQTTGQDGNTYVTNNYYNDDDYYDYAYTARIRRFNNPMWGYSYYDSYYTNSYWYDYNPHNWGVSIYCGYNWWAPSAWYAPSYTAFSWGYSPYNYWYNAPYYGYGYNPYSPYGYNNGWGSYNYGYANGYNNGYWNGYYDGLYNNPYYFNSYDNYSYNDVYNGPRRNTTGSVADNGNRTRSVAQAYNRALKSDIKNQLPVSNAYASTMALNPRTVKAQPASDVNPRGNEGELIHPKATGTNPRANGVKDNGVAPVRGNTQASDENANPRSSDVKGTEDTPHIRNTTRPADEYSNPRSNDVKGNEETPHIRNTTRPVDGNSNPRNNEVTPRNNNTPREVTPRTREKNVSTPRGNDEVTPRNPSRTETQPAPKQRNETPRNENTTPAPRQERQISQPSPSPKPSAPANNNQNNNSRPRK
jgi:hypothetical protein